MKCTINGVTYYYEWFSNYCPKRPTIMYLHGFTGTSQTFLNSFTPLLSEQYNLLAVDLLGHGQSAVFVHPYRYQMASMCADLVTLTEELGLSSFSLIGYSMGARVAIGFSQLFPDKVDQLLLESGSPGLRGRKARLLRQRSDERLAYLLWSQGIESFVDYWENIPLFSTQRHLPESQRARIRKERLSQKTFGLACSLWYMGTGVQPDFWSKLSTIQVTITLIVGEYDQKFIEIATQMRQCYPIGIRIIIVPSAGHCVHVEQPAAFRSVVQEVFLKEKK